MTAGVTSLVPGLRSPLFKGGEMIPMGDGPVVSSPPTPLPFGQGASAPSTTALDQLVQFLADVILEERQGNGAAGTSTLTPQATGGTSGVGSVTPGLSDNDMQNILSGNYTGKIPPPSSITCPPDITMDQLMDASGKLLRKMGNQKLTGDGAMVTIDGKKQLMPGGLKDNLAQLAGGKPGDIGTNKDVTLRALMILEPVKSIHGSDGKPIPDSVRHNGNLSGLNIGGRNKLGEADAGGDVGYLQDLYKNLLYKQNPRYELPTQRAVGDGHMNANDTQKSGAQYGWYVFKKKVLPILLPILALPLMLIPGLGEVAEGAAIGGEATAAGAEAAASGAEAAGEAGAEAGADAAVAGETGVGGGGDASAESGSEIGANGASTAGADGAESGAESTGEASMAEQMVQALMNQVKSQIEDQTKDQLRDQLQNWLNSNPPQGNATAPQIAGTGPEAFQQAEAALRADMSRFLQGSTVTAQAV